MKGFPDNLDCVYINQGANDGFLHPVYIKYLIRETFCYYQAHRNQFQESSSHLISFKRGKAPGDGSIKTRETNGYQVTCCIFWDKYIYYHSPQKNNK
jgi:hypothetical protein